MGKFFVNGGVALYGSVRVSGSKNASLPVIFASLAMRGVSEITGLSDIGDTRVALEIIKGFGAKVEKRGELTLIDTRELEYIIPDEQLVSRLRASTYLLSATLSRFGRAELQSFGGCNFSKRPIDMHLYALSEFGALLGERTLTLSVNRPAIIEFDKCSVGATVNALIMAATRKGESTIKRVAKEPHIMTLVEYLRSAGAEIRLEGDSFTVKGRELSGGRVTIPGDMIEAGTFLTLSLVTRGSIKVYGVNPSELSAFMKPLSDSGVEFTVTPSYICASREPRAPIDIVTAPYPEFPTDLQPIAAPLLATYCGGSIEDRVWESRFGYLAEMAKHGVGFRQRGNRAEIFPSQIVPAESEATDLRGGMANLMLALFANGESVISSAELVLRGYERLTEKLTALGAEIEYCM